jgi:iron complex outermembrane receptor protein
MIEGPKVKTSIVAAAAVGLAFSYQPLIAEDGVKQIEEIVTIGTRSSKERSASDSPVAVDVIGGDEFNAIGGTADLTDNLRAMVPSFTATPATGDGSAFVRPTSLRGMAPDQTLILVNGKRRHRAALVQFFAPAAGNGAHAADIGMIPGIALKRVEVLRDGAAAQYGSDAIAGVINLVTKDASEGGDIQVQYGQHFEGEGSTKVAANVGLPLGENGFINMSLEAMENDALSRGVQRPDAAALIAAGVAGVGADSPFDDSPLVQTWGRPETEGVRLFLNASYDLSDNASLYAFGNYGETEGRYRFFYRAPNHSSTLAVLRPLGFTGLPAGFTPYLDGEQSDMSIVTGVEGEFGNGVNYDFSISYGENELDYFLNNTVNASLGLVGGQIPQMDFDVGGYGQKEVMVNADFAREMSDTVNVGFGAEWREETYTVNGGEPNSYLGAGSSGLKGFGPQDTGSFEQDNIALYVDLEHDLSEQLLLQYALRFEDFSNFGNTTNGKVAARYRVTDSFAFRAALSTGFHAPTPGQSNVKTTITTFDGTTGLQVEEGLIRATDPDALLVGGKELKEEESFNISAGFSADLFENTTLTFDVYKIEVDDKIYRTRDISVPNTTRTVSFYSNGIDIESSGIDLVLTSGYDWGNVASTDLSFAFSYNKVEVTSQSLVNGVVPVSDSIVEDIENNYPNERFVLTANTHFGDQWNWMVRANFYGEHYDERGTIGAATNPSALIDSTFYFDTEVNYQVNDNISVTLGAINVFDEFVEEVGPPDSNRLSVGLQYPRRSAANYEGGSMYLRGQYSF